MRGCNLRKEADMAQRLDALLTDYGEMCALASGELDALRSRDWAEVERLESARRELFSRVSSAGVFVPPPGLAGEDAAKIERLKALVSELARLDESLGGAAREGMEALLQEFRKLERNRKALEVYFPRAARRGTVFIDGEM